MMMLVEIGNQRTELVDKTIDLIARKFSEIFDRLAPRARSAAVRQNPRPLGRGQGELYKNVYLPYRGGFTTKSCGGLSLAGYPFWHVFVKLVWTALEDPFFGRLKPS